MALAPLATGLGGVIYGTVAVVLSGALLWLAVAVWRARAGAEKRLFAFSILYLFALFGALAVDSLVGRI